VSVTVVSGGVRSGKSRHAQALFDGRADVTYLATGAPAADSTDPEWRDRVARHVASRPPSWVTVETLDVADVLTSPGGPVIVECLGTWLTGVVDRAGLWDDLDAAAAHVADQSTSLVAALRSTTREVVVVTNEVGWSLVPLTPPGRFFQDALGRLNAAVAEVADDVVLVVMGRALRLGAAT